MTRKIWKARCNRVHQRDLTRCADRAYQEAVNQTRAMYGAKEQLLAADRVLLDTPLEDRLRMPPDSLISWVKMTYDTVRQCILEAQDAAAAGSRDIRTYFKKTTASTRIPRKLPRRSKRKSRRALPKLTIPLPAEPDKRPHRPTDPPRQRTIMDFLTRAPTANRRQNPYLASQCSTRRKRKPKKPRTPWIPPSLYR